MRRHLLWPAVLGLLVITAAPASADGAIAIGVAKKGPNGGFSWGIVWNKPADETRSGALRTCRGDSENYKAPVGKITEAQGRCKIVTTFNQCASVSYNGSQSVPSTAYGWATAATKAEAKAQAIAHCDDMRDGRGRGCVEGGTVCEGD